MIRIIDALKYCLTVIFTVAMVVIGSQEVRASVVGPSDDVESSLGDEFVEDAAPSSESDEALFAGLSQVAAPAGLSPGDFDGSGMVDQGDLDLVLINWGRDVSALPARWTFDRPQALVDQSALDKVLVNWGSTGSPTSPVAVLPEAGSATVALLLLGSILCGRTAYRTACKGIERMRSPVA